MTIEEALRSILVTAATTAGERIYPLSLPADPTLPAIVYTRISTPRLRSLTGFAGLARPRLQFLAWASSYAAAKVLADEIRTALDGYQGTVSGLQIQSSFAENELAMLEPQTGRYGIPADFIVAHVE